MLLKKRILKQGLVTFTIRKVRYYRFTHVRPRNSAGPWTNCQDTGILLPHISLELKSMDQHHFTSDSTMQGSEEKWQMCCRGSLCSAACGDWKWESSNGVRKNWEWEQRIDSYMNSPILLCTGMKALKTWRALQPLAYRSSHEGAALLLYDLWSGGRFLAFFYPHGPSAPSQVIWALPWENESGLQAQNHSLLPLMYQMSAHL